MLTKQDYAVTATGGPTEAQRWAKEWGHFDLLLADVVMPEIKGRELAEALQTILPQMQCLYMSGYTTNVIEPEGVLL